MNLIPKICELLGVEIGEEFKISQDGEVLDDGALYKFNGIWFYKRNNADDNLDLCTDSTLLLLLNGHIEMGKCPYFKKCCPAVWDKSGEPQTNEERMRTCSTEELATVIYGIAVYDTLYDRIRNALVLNPCEDDSAGINEVMKWLKEKHNNEIV